jgi:hypothetical protein
VGLERGSLSLVSTNEELLGPEIWEYGHGDPLLWPCDTPYTQMLALTSPTRSSCSVSIVHLWTKATEFVLFVWYYRIFLVGLHSRLFPSSLTSVLDNEQLTPNRKIIQVHLIPVMIFHCVDEGFLLLFSQFYFTV